MEQNDLQALIDRCHSMAEHLLIRQDGEFYPFGATIDLAGKLTHCAHYDGDEFPLSQTKINEYRKFFTSEVEKGRIRSYAIAYDCLAQKDSNSEKSDAIAIKCYSNADGRKVVYYFTYRRVSDDQYDFGDSWGQVVS